MIPGKVYAFLGAMLLAALLGFAGAWKWQGVRLSKAQAELATVKAEHEAAVQKAAADVARAQEAAQKATAEAEARTSKVITEIRTVTKEVVREVPTYIAPATDTAFPLSDGFVCIHDAAVASQSPAPGGPCDTPDAPSDVKESEAAAVIAENYGACRECCARAEAWRQWYEQLRGGWNHASP